LAMPRSRRTLTAPSRSPPDSAGPFALHESDSGSLPEILYKCCADFHCHEDISLY
jgi:hypothetical protein